MSDEPVFEINGNPEYLRVYAEAIVLPNKVVIYTVPAIARRILGLK